MTSLGTVVIGGGLAGSATALALAKRGHRVTVFERDPVPRDKVCGEFLSHEGCRELEALGLDLNRLGAEPVDRIRLLAGGRNVPGRLPFEAMTISRRRLDHELRCLASEAGAEIRLGARVTAASEGEIRLGGERIAADTIVLASGKLDLRGSRRRPVVSEDHDRIGLKMHYRPGDDIMATLRRTIVLCFFEGGYAGLVPMDADTCNFSIALTRLAWTASGHDYARLCQTISAECPELADVLRDGNALWPHPAAIGHVPYGYRVWDEPGSPDWLWRVGDQAAVTPSLSGTGMTMALLGARVLAECLTEGRSQQTYTRRLRQSFARPMWRAEQVDALFRKRWPRRAVSHLVERIPGLLTLSARVTRIG
ncbi:flavin-dependent dehydrogenase [Palleronia aestuarii]|uniref:Flavin-dependent dehydrogenase n=1 Tax=Palleronia aestuarii TaxID=568105 RepID=A0A2W7QDL8_9RHOB|nr:NAD(P)/FAD-dependent oxidoreductase [Palleronia aestuarii]PZX19959.1 flavin-dependent dehydrogenase [Palleronia aestuarii]